MDQDFAKFLLSFADYSKANDAVGIDELIAWIERSRLIVKLGCLV
jgi:hypothetical protein